MNLPICFRPLLFVLAFFITTASACSAAEDIKVITNVAYKGGANLIDYEKEICKLDIYLPAGHKDFSTLVWFHGGGLTAGDKKNDDAIGRSMVKGGIAFISVDYRLDPKVKFPSYLQDAAAAVAWVHAHIAEYGGDPNHVFVGGHSAGGYISLMLGLDEHYLKEAGLGFDAIAGLVPVSGQVVTHYTVRAERGLSEFNIVVDEAAPIYYGRKDTLPMLVLYAEHDRAARAEENAYFVAVMKGAGNTNVTGQMISDRTHNTINSSLANENDPARLAILSFIDAHSK